MKFRAISRNTQLLQNTTRALPTPLLFLAILLIAEGALGQTLTWIGAGTNSFNMVDGLTVVTATNGCNGETVTAEFLTNGSPVLLPFANITDDGQRVGFGMDLPVAPGIGPSFELTFGGGLPVENLVFDIFDIDQLDNFGSSWTDRVRVTAFFGPTPVNINLSCADGDTICSHTIVSTGGTVAVVDGDFDNPSFPDLNGVARTTIPGPVDRVVVDYEGLGPGTSAQFVGFGTFAFDCSSVPVTLASLKATQIKDHLTVDWVTATQVATVGFHLFAKSQQGWRRLNRHLLPSHELDSLAPNSYSWAGKLGTAERVEQVRLVEVDSRGRESLYGPFSLGSMHGGRVSTKAIDWASIHQEVSATHKKRSQELALTPSQVNSRSGFPSAELEVKQTGIHRVTYEDLLEAGLDFKGAPTAELALTAEHLPVPRRIVSRRPGSTFGPGSFIEFLGEARNGLYTKTNIYRLGVDAGNAREVTEVFTAPGEEWTQTYSETVRIEENHFYSFSAPNGDPWYDDRLLAFTSPVEKNIEIWVDDLVEEGEVYLKLGIWGVTDWPDNQQDHHLKVAVNGVAVADRRFDGLMDATFEVALPRGVLQEGSNEVTLELPGDTGSPFDLVHLDNYSITYPRRLIARQENLHFHGKGRDFRIRGFSSPSVALYAKQGSEVLRWATLVAEREDNTFTISFDGRRNAAREYWAAASSALLTPSIRALSIPPDLLGEPADYLILSHPHFLPGLDEFVEAKRREGFKVRLVDVEDVYSVYSHGIFDPQAIRKYLAAARRQLNTRFVLLVGGDSYDYHGYLGTHSISYIPTIYSQTHPVVKFSPSDALLADGDEDGLPDLAIGRWPVRTLEELETLVSKTLQFSPRMAVATFAADAQDPPISFSQVSEEWMESLPPRWAVETAFVEEQGAEAARQALLDQLEKGVSIVSYFGHSGPMAWTFQNLFTADDAAHLTNEEQPFLALQWGCWNGYHSVPSYNTLSHELLFSATGGAAGVLGAATLTEANTEALFGRGVFKRLFTPGTTVGTAILEAKRELARRGNSLGILHGMTWLGDPTLFLQP